jgi:hypothetical protein
MYVRPLVYPTFTYFSLSHDSRAIEMTQSFHILAEITEEPPALRTRNTVLTFHHILLPLFERNSLEFT